MGRGGIAESLRATMWMKKVVCEHFVVLSEMQDGCSAGRRALLKPLKVAEEETRKRGGQGVGEFVAKDECQLIVRRFN